MSPLIHEFTLTEMGAHFRSGELSPVDVAKSALEAIQINDDQLQSFITLCPERTLSDAKAAEYAFLNKTALTPMTGIPYGLKDIVETAGIRTTGQSRLLANHVPATDATVAAKLAAAGGVLAGKNTTWEFAHGGPSWDVVSPPARNARNPLHHPAGSSSGTGSAIAEGFVPCGIGTDTGGSIRLPAAVCGIVGLKPTYGRVSRRGVLPNSFSHDHIGPMARTVRDTALMLQVIAGHDPLDPGSARVAVPDYEAALTGELKGVKVGVPEAWLGSASAGARADFEATLPLFTDAGAELVVVNPPALKDMGDCKKILAMSELFTIHGRTLRETPELLGESLRYRIQCGGMIRAEEYLTAARWRLRLCREMAAVYEKVDLILSPTCEPAGLLQKTDHASLFTGVSFTTPFNLTGSPALSLCSGVTELGLPYSLQIAGRPFEEATVLRAAEAFERRRGILRLGRITNPAEAFEVAA